jgi:hypothetical protein
MTNPEYRHIIMIVDRSGSMRACREPTEDGINELFHAQAAEEGRGTASLYQFDTEHDRVFQHVPLAEVPRYKLVPRGGTALLDAIGFAFAREGERLATLPEQERPGTVIAVIATDGMENSSREYDRRQIREIIQHQQQVYSWQILFIGANVDAVQVATSYGIPGDRAMTFRTTDTGVRSSYRSVNQAIARGRLGAGYGFTDAERVGAVGEDETGDETAGEA